MEWISVKNKLPDKSMRCLLTIKDEIINDGWFFPMVVTAIWQPEKHCWTYDHLDINGKYNTVMQNTVTHWMEMPMPAQEKD